MPKLLFKVDGIVSGKVVYEAGKIYDISDEKGSATRWLKRGAEIVQEEPKKQEIIKEVIQEAQVPVVNKPSKKENKKEIKTSK